MITLHHLNKSRSKRIIWLLEELGVEYRIIPYLRDASTFLAPATLKEIHPLGKSPVIDVNGLVIAESGAIIEYLIDRYAPNLAPPRNTDDYVDYLQWLHFAESSAMLPLLLKMFLAKDGCETNFLNQYADNEATKIIDYIDQSLNGKQYFVGNKLTGADIIMSFVVEILHKEGNLDQYPNIAAYFKHLESISNYQKANEIEQQYS